MRGGRSINSSKCTLTLDECQNFIMDHCSVSWGPWDNVHIKDANNITWQYCINSEGIEPQRFGSITDGTRNWTVHHCLWADNKSRNPKMKCYMQYYNNVVYNYGMGIIGGHSAADNYQDVMNNYFIAGPNGSAKYFDDWTATDHKKLMSKMSKMSTFLQEKRALFSRTTPAVLKKTSNYERFTRRQAFS